MMSHDDPMSETNGNRLPINPELISAFYDGETTPEERAAVEACMDPGSATLQVLDEYDQLSQSLRQLHSGVPAPDFAQSVLAQIRPLAPKAASGLSKTRRRLMSIAAGLSGLAAAVTLLMWPRMDARQENMLAVSDPQIRYTSTAAPAMSAEGAIALPEPAGAMALAPMSEPSAAEMEARIASSLAEMTSDSPLPEVGEVVGYLDENAEELTWVAVTVVDVQSAGNQVQLLLTKHGVESPGTTGSAPAPAPSPDVSNQMTFLVEADWDQMEAVILDLTDAEYVDALAINAPREEGVPEVLQRYAMKREAPTARGAENPSAEMLRQSVQERQNPAGAAVAEGDPGEENEAIQVQLQMPEDVLRRIAARRGVQPSPAAGEPVPPEPAESTAADPADGPALAVSPSRIGRPLASTRAKAVIVIQQQNR
jgi:hypothetical protein